MTFKRLWAILSVVLVLASTSTLSACDPRADLVIENGTPQTLTIRLVDEMALGTIGPGMQVVRKGIPTNVGRMLIEAMNEMGEVVFSKKLAFREMKNVGGGTYKVVITETVHY